MDLGASEMQLLLPAIEELSIRRLSACASIELPEDAKLVTWLEKHGNKHKDAKYSDTEWLHLYAGVWKRTTCRAHLHLDLATDSYFKTIGMGRPPTSTIEAIQSEASKFQGMELKVGVECTYLVPRDALPSRGMISAMLGISTKSMGATLNLSGAQMSVNEAPYDAVEWKLADEGNIEVSICHEQTALLDEHYLERLLAHSQDGFQRFILEKRTGDAKPKIKR